MAAPSSFYTCRACKALEQETFVASERMLGLGGGFKYLKCAACGSVSLAEIPDDVGRFYPSAGYYSFIKPADVVGAGFRNSIFRWHRWLSGARPLDLKVIRKLVPDVSTRILDIGSGAGEKLERLWVAGYRNICGIDPFLPPEAVREHPFPLRRSTVSEAGKGWGMIMYHHVLEHVPDPEAEIAKAAENLATGGLLLIRVPVADCWAFEHYRENWVQLDAPRHLCLMTRKALLSIAAKKGLKRVALFDDSTSFQFWGSRLYRDPVATLAAASAGSRTRRVLRWFPEYAIQTLLAFCLNQRMRGDQSCFVFQKTGDQR